MQAQNSKFQETFGAANEELLRLGYKQVPINLTNTFQLKQGPIQIQRPGPFSAQHGGISRPPLNIKPAAVHRVNHEQPPVAIHRVNHEQPPATVHQVNHEQPPVAIHRVNHEQPPATVRRVNHEQTFAPQGYSEASHQGQIGRSPESLTTKEQPPTPKKPQHNAKSYHRSEKKSTAEDIRIKNKPCRGFSNFCDDSARGVDQLHLGDVRFVGQPQHSDIRFAGQPQHSDIRFAGQPYLGDVRFAGQPYLGDVRFMGQPYLSAVCLAGQPQHHLGNVRLAEQSQAEDVRPAGQPHLEKARENINLRLNKHNPQLLRQSLFQGASFGLNSAEYEKNIEFSSFVSAELKKTVRQALDWITVSLDNPRMTNVPDLLGEFVKQVEHNCTQTDNPNFQPKSRVEQMDLGQICKSLAGFFSSQPLKGHQLYRTLNAVFNFIRVLRNHLEHQFHRPLVVSFNAALASHVNNERLLELSAAHSDEQAWEQIKAVLSLIALPR